jgi:hypothetical protein
VAQTRRAWLRATVLFVCASVVAGSFGVVLTSTWQARAQAHDRTDREQRGVAYLHPMTGLIGQLVQAQTAAVRGAKVDPDKLRKSFSSVAAADQANGALLGTTQRFLDLRTKAESALADTGTPRERYQTWSDVVALAINLGRTAGDNAGLTHDSDDDLYYAAQSALVALPDVMVQAGRAADLASLAGTAMLTGDDAERAAIARYAVASDGETVTNDLNKAISATENHTLGSTIALPLDAFRTAVAAFTPPTAVTQTAPATADQLVTGSKAIFDTALPLTHSLLTQVGNLLVTRTGQLDQLRQRHQLAGGGAILAYLLAVVALLARRRRPRPVVDPPAPAPRNTTRPRRGAEAAREPEPVLAGRPATNHRGAH